LISKLSSENSDSSNIVKGKLAERQGRKAIGSKMRMHYDSLATMWSCVINLPTVAGFSFSN